MSSVGSGGGGWFTTKKRGRDDDRIQEDRARAIAVRQAQRRRKVGSNATSGAATAASRRGKSQRPPSDKQQRGRRPRPPRKRRRPSPSSESDSQEEDGDGHDSLDGFIVKDDDEDDDDEDSDLHSANLAQSSTGTCASGDDDDDDIHDFDDLKSRKPSAEQPKPAKPQQQRHTQPALDLVGDDDRKETQTDQDCDKNDDDEDEPSSFFRPFQRRTSRPSAALARAQRAKTTTAIATAAPFNRRPKNTSLSSSRPTHTSFIASRGRPGASQQPTTGEKKEGPVSAQFKKSDDLESSDDDLNILDHHTFASQRKPSQWTITNNVAPSAATVPLATTKSTSCSKPLSVKGDASDDSWLVDTPESKTAKRPVSRGKPNMARGISLKRPKNRFGNPLKPGTIDVDEDNDGSSVDDLLGLSKFMPQPSSSVVHRVATNPPHRAAASSSRYFASNDGFNAVSAHISQPAHKNPTVPGNVITKKKRIIDLDDDVDDDDEAIALAWALEESRKESAKSAHRQQQKQQITPLAPLSKHDQMLEVADTTFKDGDDLFDEDDKEEDDAEEDDYMGDEAREASSVLETANQLSARVLEVMSAWSASTNGTVPVGMIVDGALALFHGGAESPTTNTNRIGISNSNGIDDVEHGWISHETMKQILPRVTLAEYQLIGVNWMALLHGMKCQVPGRRRASPVSSSVTANVNGVLADEMGLGKTVQTIAFLSWLKCCQGSNSVQTSKRDSSNVVSLDDSSDDGRVDLVEDAAPTGLHSKSNSFSDGAYHPHLVVAPSSVLSNWEQEFQKFSSLHVVKYHGTQNERLEIQRQLSQYLPGKSKSSAAGGAPDVILVPITYFQKEKSDDRSFLRKFRYNYMVIDEAHLLKNPRGIRYKSLDKFGTMHRLLLTGTPVQNSPQELMALLCFLMPLFSRKSSIFDDEGGKGVDGEKMLRHFVSLEGGTNESDEAAYTKLKQLFAPFVLRRRKVDVLSQIMPPKERRVEFVQMDDAAKALYNGILANHVRAKKKGPEATSATTISKEHIFTALRKAAHHPLLLRSRYTSPTEKERLAHHFYQYGAFRGEACTKAKVAEELEKFNDFDIHLTALELIDANPHRRVDLQQYVLAEEDLFCSAKFVRLKAILPGLIADGHRILIFSMWTSCLDLLSCLLEQLDLTFLRMEGNTPVEQRQSLIDQFNNESSIPVFLLSTTACGLGINLTSADVCIIHDLSFNPMNDEQAEDRCHRIGQKKPVAVIHMVTVDTVDYDIYEMQQRKAKMSAAIMKSGSNATGASIDTVMNNNRNGKNQNIATTWDSKQAAKAKELVLQTAVDRFLQSPQGKKQLTRQELENACDHDEDEDDNVVVVLDKENDHNF